MKKLSILILTLILLVTMIACGSKEKIERTDLDYRVVDKEELHTGIAKKVSMACSS